jgi:NAD(P)-dependent dehydrogenase (short-subunit alcohol dehydrogenase family)
MATQRVLITAGASGIGREIARAFVANGAAVFVCDLDTKALEAIAVETPALKTGVCDVANRQDIERMMDECAKALGGLDVLVNNAGIAGPRMRLPSGALSASRRRSRLSSVDTEFVQTRSCPAPSMALAFSESSRDVRRRQANHSKRSSATMGVQSIKRLVDPRDIAALAVFLASDAAKSISGQMLPIDNDMQQTS